MQACVVQGYHRAHLTENVVVIVDVTKERSMHRSDIAHVKLTVESYWFDQCLLRELLDNIQLSGTAPGGAERCG